MERCFPGHLIGVEGSFREIFMENIHIGYGDLKMREAVELTFDADIESVEMHFLLTGDTWACDDESSREFTFTGGSHNLIYAPGVKGRMIFPAGQRIRVFEVNLNPALCRKWFPVDAPQFDDFLRHSLKQRITQLVTQHPPITPAMQMVIQDILASRHQGTLQKMYLEAKVVELLVLQLEQFIKGDAPSARLSIAERQRMVAVKDHLANHLSEQYTLAELARTFGTNEYALKRNFKNVFGTTVFSYWQDVKMREARKLLTTEGLPVKAVADLVGYKNPQHFGTAFKRRYGYPPSRLS